MRTEKEILDDIEWVYSGSTLSGSAEAMTLASLRHELKECRAVNPTLEFE